MTHTDWIQPDWNDPSLRKPLLGPLSSSPDLWNEVQALRARVAEAEARAQQAEAENGRLREAVMHAYASLKFYGDKKSYDQPVRIMESPLIFQDNGVRARMWLNVYSQYNPVTYNSAALAATAEAENGRLKLAASNIVSWYDGHWHGETVYANLLTKCISDLRAALAASAPETGEQEAMLEDCFGWVCDHHVNEDGYHENIGECMFCGTRLDWERRDGNLDWYGEHEPDCLHLRAKALRAQAGGEGSQ